MTKAPNLPPEVLPQQVLLHLKNQPIKSIRAIFQNLVLIFFKYSSLPKPPSLLPIFCSTQNYQIILCFQLSRDLLQH